MPVQMHPETAVGELKAGAHKFPLQAVDVRGTVRGLLYSATITQKFLNDRDSRMEAIYVFPLPPKAAVHNFELRIGDRVVEGEIKERGAARREYRAAIQAGHRAALMEEERSDIFTTTVGNIGPGEEVTIKFEISGPLSCFKNTARLRLPLVVGEVFIPGNQLSGKSVGDGIEMDTDEVPDASRISPPRLADGVPNPVALSVSFTVEKAGLQITDVASTCHFARTKRYKDGRHRVSLLPGVERLDRAFVLEVTYPENTLQTSLLVDREKKAFALTVVPPAARERTSHPRDVVILLDRSGSMSGWPMIAARRAAARIIDSLTQDDRFGIVAFDSRNVHFDFKNGLCHANSFYKMRAAEFLNKIDAEGGTNMLPALRDGMRYFSQADNRDPHIILVTDGDVGNDSSLIRSAQTGIRISTVGIGYAAREGLLNRMAEASGGLCTLIPNESELDQELAEMHRKWGQPVWKGLSLAGADEKFRSPKFWDVWQDVPTTFFGRLDELPEVTTVSGWFQGKGQYSQEIEALDTQDPVVFRAWARARLLDLEDLFLVNKAAPAELVKLSVEAQVLCRFTAFSAVDKSEKVDTEKTLDKVVQPVEQTIQRKSLSAKPMLGLQSHSGARGAVPPTMLRSRAMPPAPPAPPAPGYGGGGGNDPFLGGSDDESLFEASPCLDMDMGSGECFSEALFEEADFEEPMMESMLESKREVHRLDEAGLFDDDAKVSDLLQQAPAPKAAPKSDLKPSASPTNWKDMLSKDTLLTLGLNPSNDALKSCLKHIKQMIEKLTIALRSEQMANLDAWKQVLSKLLDYQDALQDVIDGESLSEARSLRKELEKMVNRL